MPNWVSNSVSVRGSTEDLAKFRELAKGKGSPTGIENGKLTYDERRGALSFWNFILNSLKEFMFLNFFKILSVISINSFSLSKSRKFGYPENSKILIINALKNAKPST